MNAKNAISTLTRVAAALSATLVEAVIFWSLIPS
jgi:hypothetical protein